MGFVKGHGDHTLFIKQAGDDFLVVLVYVDDILIASTSPQAASELTASLQHCFKLRDLGALKYFLGLEIARTSAGISLFQRKYALDLLSSTGMSGCKPFSVPTVPNLKLSKSDGVILSDTGMY